MDLESRTLERAGNLWVLAKPPGIPTSGRHLDDPDCLQTHLIQSHGGMVWAVHQLDADTSGVNIFVTEKRGVRAFQKEWGHEETRKLYLAFVRGVFPEGRVECTAPVGWVDERNLGVTSAGKEARTSFLRLGTSGQVSLVAARLWTGRTHQIRIHAAHLGHPLIGEEWYGEAPCSLHPRQALHAIRFDSPRFSFYCPLEEDLLALAEEVGLPIPGAEETVHLFR